MGELKFRKLLKYRYILFFPCVSIYMGIFMLILKYFDLSSSDIQAISVFSSIPIVLTLGKSTYDYLTEKNVDKSILILSWLLTMLGIGLMMLAYFIKAAS